MNLAYYQGTIRIHKATVCLWILGEKLAKEVRFPRSKIFFATLLKIHCIHPILLIWFQCLRVNFPKTCERSHYLLLIRILKEMIVYLKEIQITGFHPNFSPWSPSHWVNTWDIWCWCTYSIPITIACPWHSRIIITVTNFPRIGSTGAVISHDSHNRHRKTVF